jgi:uncharacterized protein (DUF58 family)
MKNTMNSVSKHTGRTAALGAAVLGLLLVAAPLHSGLTAPAVTLTASVQNQQCQGGDNVSVTLTATLTPPQRNVRFSWDFNNDGIFDTAPSANPTVTTQYPDEVNVTATVKVTKGTRSATDSVTFTTLRCGG